MRNLRDERSTECKMEGRGYYTFFPKAYIPVDVENKTGIAMEIEIHTFQQGRLAIILRPITEIYQP